MPTTSATIVVVFKNKEQMNSIARIIVDMISVTFVKVCLK